LVEAVIKERNMNDELQPKTKLLNALGTAQLYERLEKLIDDVSGLQMSRQKLVDENPDFIGSGSRDCEAVKAVEVGLLLRAPDIDGDGKKITADRRSAWLENEKRRDKAWQQALTKQRELSAALANLDIEIEKASRRYSALKSYLELRTAQINFLSK